METDSERVESYPAMSPPSFSAILRGILVHRSLPWIFGFIALGLTILLWETVRVVDERKLGMMTQLELNNIASVVHRRFEIRALAMQRIVAHWEEFGRPNREEWMFDANQFVRGHQGYQSVGWVDSNYLLRWLVPLQGEEDALGLDMRREQFRRDMLMSAYEERKTTLSRLLNLPEGGRGVSLAIPIFNKTIFDGFIVASFHIGTLLELFLRSELPMRYSLSIWDGDEKIFGRGEKSPVATRFQKEGDFTFFGVRWKIKVWPNAETVSLANAHVANIILFGGLFISFLIALLTRFAQVAARQVQEAETLRRREIALKERASANRKLSALMEAAPDAMVILDSGYCIDMCNSATERFFGYTLAELKGKHVNLLISGKEKGNGANGGNGGEVAFLRGAHNVWLRRRDGSRFAADLEVSSITTEGGFYRIASIRDITERHEFAAALEKKSDELERSNKDLENFAYIASHDLQEPLRMIATYLTLLQKKYDPVLDANGKDYVHYCIDSSMRLNRMIRALLLLARVSSSSESQFEIVDMNATVKEALADLRVAITEANVEVMVDSLPEITGEKTHLRQLFQNLIANAIKFRKNDVPGKIEIRSRTMGKEIEFCVKDNGIGFEMQYADQVFGLFQRLHSRREYSGSGLGLALCRRIVERHGGRIWVRTAPDAGATFTFTIPQVKGKAAFGESKLIHDIRTEH